MNRESLHKILWVCILNAAFAVVEADVVIYIRWLFYPNGFNFPLVSPNSQMLTYLSIEYVREIATLVMLTATGILAGSKRWDKFAYFGISFGVWDIMFYVWLKVQINWPASILDWDLLFLIPLPWIGPVIAPVIISITLIIAGLVIIHLHDSGRTFKPPLATWLLCIVGSVIILLTFILDFSATMFQQMPQPYHYDYFFLAIGMYVVALIYSVNKSKIPTSSS